MSTKPKKKAKRKYVVPEWRQAWRWFSVQIMALIAAAQGLLIFVPTIKDYIPATWLHSIMGALAVLAILGRVVQQGGDNGKN